MKFQEEMSIDESQVLTTNAIMFADGETWYVIARPNATFEEIIKDWVRCGGNSVVNVYYPGLKFGVIIASLAQYRDCLTTGLKAFFRPRPRL